MIRGPCFHHFQGEVAGMEENSIQAWTGEGWQVAAS
jgi:hypothetical protein